MIGKTIGITKRSFESTMSIPENSKVLQTLPANIRGEAPDIQRIKVQKQFSFEVERETDRVRINTRLKQISFGKNTTGYDNYIRLVPKNQRRGYKEHPRTPDPEEKLSKRTFDGQIKAWRRALHEYDSSATQDDLDFADDLGEKMQFGSKEEDGHSKNVENGESTKTKTSGDGGERSEETDQPSMLPSSTNKLKDLEDEEDVL